MGNRYGTAQQKVGKWPSAARSMDEAHKCTILESDGKIANGDISEDEGASVAKIRRDTKSLEYLIGHGNSESFTPSKRHHSTVDAN
jgi:hypothetical protein